jgi:hypothetical protein
MPGTRNSAFDCSCIQKPPEQHLLEVDMTRRRGVQVDENESPKDLPVVVIERTIDKDVLWGRFCRWDRRLLGGKQTQRAEGTSDLAERNGRASGSRP